MSFHFLKNEIIGLKFNETENYFWVPLKWITKPFKKFLKI